MDELASNDRPNDKGEEDDKQEEVQDSKADDSALAQLRLLEGVDWRTNLTA